MPPQNRRSEARPHVLIAGGGIAGSRRCSHRGRWPGRTPASSCSLTPEHEPLEVFGAEAAARVRGLLEQKGIALHTAARSGEADGGQVTLVDGSSLPADASITVPRLEGRRTFGLPADGEGFIPVDSHGRVEGTREVYVAGDEANFR